MSGLRKFVAGALVAGAPALLGCGLAVPALAQVVASPATVETMLPASEQGEVSVVVQNEGAMAVKLFAVPFPEGGIPEDVGEMLFSTEPGEAHYPD